MPKPASPAERKEQYCEKLTSLLKNHPKIFIVHCDNVGSLQMQRVRHALRGKAVILMGKNTMIRRVLRENFKQSPMERLLPLLKSNVGFVFCIADLNEVREVIQEHKVPAAARAGIVAPCDVNVPAQNTGLEPGMTSFFQALGIPTKINRGAIEILQDVQLIKEGDKVGTSEATLLTKLSIKPFSYGLIIHHVYDNGTVYDPSVLDLTDDDILSHFLAATENIGALSLQIGYPTIASAPHSIINAFKNIQAVSVECDYTFPGSEKIKAYLADPSAFAVAAPAAGAAAGAGAAAKAAEPEEESDDEMGLDLFG